MLADGIAVCYRPFEDSFRHLQRLELVHDLGPELIHFIL